MSDERPINDLSALEAALASLVPRADRLNRDRLMFLAGQASAGQSPLAAPVALASPRRWPWQAAFAAMTAVAAGLLVALVVQPGPQVGVARPERSDGRGETKVAKAKSFAKPQGVPPLAPAEGPPQAVPGTRAAGIAADNEASESLPLWPFGSLILGRPNWRQEQLAHAGLSLAAGADLLENGPEEAVQGTKQPVEAAAGIPATPSPPMSYRQWRDKLLKESGA